MSIIEKAIQKLEKQSHGPADAHEFERGTEPQPVSPVLPSAAPAGRVKRVEEPVELPLVRLDAMGFITPQRPRSLTAEEYRLIKRPLLTNIDGKGAAAIENANLVMVTSALQGEGKTYTSINLAMSISLEQDRTVLLVDGDMAKASAGATLGIPSDRPGLIDLLEHDDISVEDVLLHTSVPNLRIIPAGRVHERSTELLASESMRRLCLELSQRYADRVVIFDSPPVLLTTESSVLASLMGQIVFVVAAEKTSTSAVTEAVDRISGDKMIGMILNKTRPNLLDKFGFSYGYSYGYGSGYGYGYGYGEDARSRQDQRERPQE